MVNLEIPPIRDRTLWRLALTHRSYTNEASQIAKNNERLEFLGDAVLGFVVGELLYKLYPEMSEAQLTRLRSQLVDETQLGKLGAELGLGKLIYLGKGAEKDGGRKNLALLNDTFEAIIGAYFLDAGIEAVSSYIQPVFARLAQNLVQKQTDAEVTNFTDTKNQLQQWALANYHQYPIYEIISEQGPDHAKEFTVQVSIQERVYGMGKGRRKKTAQKQAAAVALKKIQTDYPE
ncbi:MAG TPA: ribonuclease III [Xenococcaceae cyanobacterium]|jgi:ribonuclease-3